MRCWPWSPPVTPTLRALRQKRPKNLRGKRRSQSISSTEDTEKTHTERNTRFQSTECVLWVLDSVSSVTLWFVLHSCRQRLRAQSHDRKILRRESSQAPDNLRGRKGVNGALNLAQRAHPAEKEPVGGVRAGPGRGRFLPHDQ